MEEEKNPIQVADRLFGAMEIMAAKGPLTLMQLSKELELNKSTVHRILNSLIYMGYAKQDIENGKYAMSYKILGLANQVLEKSDVLTMVRPFLKKLASLSGETVHFVQLDGNEAVYIDKVESYQNSVRMVSKVGNRIPLYCSGVGKAIAAQLKDNEVDLLWKNSNIQSYTKNTVVELDKFKKLLKQVRKLGYALDNEEMEIGVRCIAVCITDFNGKPRYAFSISAPISRMTDQRVKELAVYILDAKADVIEEMR
ncbi:MAG: IclR family transcriptional regulator [Lachnospiraceae bacterium]